MPCPSFVNELAIQLVIILGFSKTYILYQTTLSITILRAHGTLQSKNQPRLSGRISLNDGIITNVTDPLSVQHTISDHAQYIWVRSVNLMEARKLFLQPSATRFVVYIGRPHLTRRILLQGRRRGP